jgi:ElaB/YqjD/DUF883 family membrane-anchored ribosome-binding protein
MENPARQLRKDELNELFVQIGDPKLDRVDAIINQLEDQLEVDQERMQRILKALQDARQLIGYADSFHAPKVIYDLEVAIRLSKETLGES